MPNPSAALLPINAPSTPIASVVDDAGVLIAIGLLATGVRRTLARHHRYNESVHPRDATFGVDHPDQTVISADAPTTGA